MKYTSYGHSCFLVEVGGKKLLFDPFITPNELATNIDKDKIEADFILVSHGHFDHTADLVDIAKATKAKVICSWEIHEWLNVKGIEATHPMNTGGKWNFGEFSVKCTAAEHSSGLPDGSYGGNPLGFIVMSEEKNFYYSGDTALTMDMQLIPRWSKLDFAILPIGDNFTMDVHDAVACASMIESKIVVGVHYDTFGFIKINHDEAQKVFEQAGLTLHLLSPGKTVDL